MGTFILSLDCEGLWGMADNAAMFEAGQITNASLAEAYDFLVRCLDRNGVRATAAFVTAFAVPREALRESIPAIEELAQIEPWWFANTLPRIRSGGVPAEGLGGHAFWLAMQQAGHEMAWHGTTHLPLGQARSRASLDAELRIEDMLSAALPGRAASAVFPRNQVRWQDELHRYGFGSFRAASGQGTLARAAALAREWLVTDRCAPSTGEWTDKGFAVTAGHFLNWPSGPRRLVPARITIARWRSILRSAARSGGCAHMWFHPHNLITAPAMREVLDTILGEVDELRKAGVLRVETMHDASQRSEHGAGVANAC